MLAMREIFRELGLCVRHGDLRRPPEKHMPDFYGRTVESLRVEGFQERR
jgi:hypothetical protein